jgi:hypothetical protein
MDSENVPENTLLPLMPPPAEEPPKPPQQRRVQTKARKRQPAVRVSQLTRVCTDDGFLLDTVHGGIKPEARSRGASGRVSRPCPLVDFHDHLRRGQYNVDKLPTKCVTDRETIRDALVGEHVYLLHHVMSPRALMLAYDFAMQRAGSPKRCGDDFETCVSNLGDLVGHPVLLGSRLIPTKNQIDAHVAKLRDIVPGVHHEYALQPMFASVTTPALQNDAGGIFFQGVVISPLCFNHPAGDEDRLVTGLTPNGAFDDVWICVLVTHVYTTSAGDGTTTAPLGGIPWSSINPCSTFVDVHGVRRVDPLAGGRNVYNGVFMWNEYMDYHKDDAGGISGLTNFALAECKQMRGVLRKLLPPMLTVAAGNAILTELKERGELGKALTERYATVAGFAGRNDKRRREAEMSGNDLRKCLLASLLLMDTPLEGVLFRDAARIRVPNVPDLAGLVTEFRDFLRASPQRPDSVPAYQSMYEAWLGRVCA